MLRKLQIESKINSLKKVEKVIDELSGEIGISSDSYSKILVSVIEGVNNAIVHGNNCEPERIVEIEFRFKNKMLEVKIQDEGKGFNPEEIPDPTAPENREELNGRGVFIMKKLSDGIRFSAKGNSVTMTFKNIC